MLSNQSRTTRNWTTHLLKKFSNLEIPVGRIASSSLSDTDDRFVFCTDQKPETTQCLIYSVRRRQRSSMSTWNLGIVLLEITAFRAVQNSELKTVALCDSRSERKRFSK
ncbi:hypothetical protein CEXT_756271 [Caerostris extrusa]|uniref:Uncharacterized protein n=1 Tax=Caerostris extrusa TaxID=172846 RepID=A0AAV4Y4S8_CAEEX|nr:hypothetical protein CEXT_756271 [Caerostris extrusa]